MTLPSCKKDVKKRLKYNRRKLSAFVRSNSESEKKTEMKGVEWKCELLRPY